MNTTKLLPRRRTALFPVLAVLAVLACCPWPAEARAPDRSLHPFPSARKPGDCDRVVGLLEAGGEVKESADGKIERLSMSVTCAFTYDERTLEVPSEPDGRGRAVRLYEDVDATIKVEEVGFKPVLRADRRLVAVETSGRTVTLFSPHGTVTRDELDLIDILANSLLIDRLLPENPVRSGDAWKLPRDLVIALLGLDAAVEADVEATLTEVTETAARFELAGEVDGSVGGVGTKIELKGRYRYNRQTNRIDWLGFLIREDRAIGHAKRGVDAVARLQITITPVETPAPLADESLAGLTLEPTSALTQLSCKGGQGAWTFTYDRNWFITRDEPSVVVLRKIDGGELIAQCNVSPLPDRPADKPSTLDEFQADVQRALGENFGSFVSAGQYANESNYRVYRVVARGVVSELPIEWRYYLLSDEQGRRVAFAFTLEEKLADRLGEDDRQIVDSLRLNDAKIASNGPR